MNVQTIELDVSKYGTGVCVKVGQGDAGGTTIKAIIYDGASGFDLSGSVVRMVALLPDRRHYYRGACTVDGNTATHVCDESKLCAVSGYTDEAYFEIEKDGSTYSTDRFALEIVRSALDGQMPSENWDSAVTDMIDKGNAAIEEVGDALRDATEGYAAAEADRTQRYESAESSRDSSFAEAEAARDSAQAENDVAQAKNNADQINNNLMAQANRYVKLGSDEYDHDTGVPTLADPQQGITYLVPKPREGVYNNYDGWVWLLSDDGSTGAWELIGPANPTPDVITTDDIDAAFSGSGKTGMRYMALNAYNYLVAKMKSAFAEKSHKHGDADITAVNGAKLSDASVSRAKLDAGLEQDIADLEAARDSVSQSLSGAVGWIPISYFAKNGVCTVGFSSPVAFTIAATDSTTVGQLPDGIRPAMDVRARIAVMWLPDVLDLVVTTSGAVLVSAPVAGVSFDAHHCAGSVTFVIA